MEWRLAMIRERMKMKWMTCAISLAFGLVLWGCGVAEEGEPLQEASFDEAFVDDSPPAATGKADELTLSWEILQDVDIPSERLAAETRRVLSTSRAFEEFFGTPAPESVDFDEQWVFFFTPGADQAGLQADLDLIRYAGSLRSLQIVTKTTNFQGDCGPGEDQVDSILAAFLNSTTSLMGETIR